MNLIWVKICKPKKITINEALLKMDCELIYCCMIWISNTFTILLTSSLLQKRKRFARRNCSSSKNRYLLVEWRVYPPIENSIRYFNIHFLFRSYPMKKIFRNSVPIGLTFGESVPIRQTFIQAHRNGRKKAGAIGGRCYCSL